MMICTGEIELVAQLFAAPSPRDLAIGVLRGDRLAKQNDR